MSDRKKYRDINGFLHLEGTPISRVQVAPYLGRQIDSKGKMDISPKLDPKEIYGVFRPPEELFDEETMKSFDGMPFRVGHQMLGKKDSAGNAMLKGVDSEPVDGCFFNVRRDEDRPDYLIADIVIYTDKALRALANGTKELSLGYRCIYEPVDSYPEPEFYKGQPYLFKQKGIVANHLALVPHGRAGSSVCVQDEAVVTVDGLVITCDSLPEEIDIMEEKDKKVKEKLTALLAESDEQVQNCLDYCDLTEEQKAKVKELKNGKVKVEEKTEAKETVEDEKKDGCSCCVANDAQPPVPPPEKPEGVKPVEKVDPKNAKEEPKKEEPVAEPVAKPSEPAAPAEPTASAPVEGAAPAASAAEPAATAEKPVEDCGVKKEVAKDCGDKKTYTQDELDEAVKRAAEKARKDAFRAKLLGDAVGEDAADKTEGDVARAACKKIKGLEFAADASDEVAIAAIRGHLANKAAAKKAEEKPAEPAPAKPAPKKTLLSVPTQDEAIAKTPVSFNSGKFKSFLAIH